MSATMWSGLVGRRLLATLPTLLLASVAVFLLLQLIPGDPAVAIAGDSATPERLAQLRSDLGLDRSLPAQYASWAGHALTGDLGASVSSGQSVTELIGQRLPTTLMIGAGGVLFALAVGVPMGIAAAMRHGRPADKVITALVTLGIAIPSFWLGLVLIRVVAVELGVLPSGGWVSFSQDPVESLRRAVLPAVTIGAIGAAEVGRQLRSAMVEVLQADFIRTHRAKGLPGRLIIWKHALKNSGIPLITIVGLLINGVLGATVVVEAVFALPGVGSLVVQATTQRDYPIIQGVILTYALLMLAVNLLVDISYRLIDPRIE